MKCLQKIRDKNTWKMKSRWGLNVSTNSFKKVRNLKKLQVKIVDILFMYYFKFHNLIYLFIFRSNCTVKKSELKFEKVVFTSNYSFSIGA